MFLSIPKVFHIDDTQSEGVELFYSTKSSQIIQATSRMSLFGSARESLPTNCTISQLLLLRQELLDFGLERWEVWVKTHEELAKCVVVL
jgi:hypothetical protein